MEQFYIISNMDYPMLYAYMGQFPVYRVINAYELAFGSVQVLAYEKDTIIFICDRYIKASEDEQKKFCVVLEWQFQDHNETVIKKSENVSKRSERKQMSNSD